MTRAVLAQVTLTAHHLVAYHEYYITRSDVPSRCASLQRSYVWYLQGCREQRRCFGVLRMHGTAAGQNP